MSLGLKDVGSKKQKTKVPVCAVDEPQQLRLEAAEPAPFKERARPWSTSGLARQGLSRKEAVGRDAHVTDEWAELHEAPLFWIDLTEGWAASVYDRVSKVEARVREVVAKTDALWRAAKWALNARRDSR